MSRRPSRRDALSRAEARRRARYEAQGRTPDEEGEEEAASDEQTPGPRPAGGSLLQRLFPAPPPLPGKPDPLAGFSHQGRFRGLFEALYLLRRYPLPWLVGGLVWALGRLLSGDSATGVLASLVSFTALIGAGWIGWWRPWLAGLAASIVGWLVFLGLLGALTVTGGPTSSSPTPGPSGSQVAGASQLATASQVASASPAPISSASPVLIASPAASPSTAAPRPSVTASDIALTLTLQTVIQLALGAGAGWYGGYLRRRMVSATPARTTKRRR